MNLAVLTGTAKQRPWALAMMAVLMPTTSPEELTSGPPELPGLSAASGWMTLSMRRREWERKGRPAAETTPGVTVAWKPGGLPRAMTSWPGRREEESPREAAGKEEGGVSLEEGESGELGEDMVG